MLVFWLEVYAYVVMIIVYTNGIIVRMTKITTVVASYSGLYEEGEVEHINCVCPNSTANLRLDK